MTSKGHSRQVKRTIPFESRTFLHGEPLDIGGFATVNDEDLSIESIRFSTPVPWQAVSSLKDILNSVFNSCLELSQERGDKKDGS